MGFPYGPFPETEGNQAVSDDRPMRRRCRTVIGEDPSDDLAGPRETPPGMMHTCCEEWVGIPNVN